MGRTACTEPQCLNRRAITLLPLWTVHPVQSLSACTVQLYLYSLYGPYSLYRASVPVQYSYTSAPLSTCTVQLYLYSPQYLYSTAIPLLPSVPVQYSYTSTPLSPCTVQLYLYSPQYLYSTAIPLLPSVPVQRCALPYVYVASWKLNDNFALPPYCSLIHIECLQNSCVHSASLSHYWMPLDVACSRVLPINRTCVLWVAWNNAFP